MYMIKEMKKELRPRERLMSQGAGSLSDAELLAILLQTGTKLKSVLELSQDVLNSIKNLHSLNHMSVSELSHVKGIKSAKACTIIAAIELGRRLELKQENKQMLSDNLDVYKMMAPILKHLNQEHFYVIFLNTKSCVIDKKCIFVGTLNQTVVHPREIFNEAIKLMAHSIILVHNHPSGDSTASKADFQVTDVLLDAAEIIGIPIADHIIIGDHEYYSIKFKRKNKYTKNNK